MNTILPGGHKLPLSEIKPKLECFSKDGPEKLFEDWEHTAKQVMEWLPAQGIIKGTGAGAKIIFILHGFKNDVESEWMQDMKNAILMQETSCDVMVILVGWGGGADLFLTKYNTSVHTLPVVSEWLSPILRQLRQTFPDVYLHGIGHSLGAHGMGMAGRLSGGAFDRITGLDPAGPHFEKDDQKDIRLSATDAAQVDVIHTDGCKPGPSHLVNFGTLMPLGKLDFYVNYGIPPQPGVGLQRIYRILLPLTGILPAIVPHVANKVVSNMESHSRAYQLFTWSVTNPDAFKTKQILDGKPGPDQVVKKTKPSVAWEGQMGYHLESPSGFYSNLYVETSGKPDWEPKASSCILM